MRQELHFLLVGWVLMPEHFHILIRPEPAESTPLVMKGSRRNRPGASSRHSAKTFNILGAGRRLRGYGCPPRFTMNRTTAFGSAAFTPSMSFPNRSFRKNWTTCTTTP